MGSKRTIAVMAGGLAVVAGLAVAAGISLSGIIVKIARLNVPLELAKPWSERLVGVLIGESKVDSDSEGLVAATEDCLLEGSSGR